MSGMTNAWLTCREPKIERRGTMPRDNVESQTKTAENGRVQPIVRRKFAYLKQYDTVNEGDEHKPYKFCDWTPVPEKYIGRTKKDICSARFKIRRLCA